MSTGSVFAAIVRKLKEIGITPEPGSETETTCNIVVDGAFYALRLVYECKVEPDDPWKGEPITPLGQLATRLEGEGNSIAVDALDMEF